MYKKIIAAKKTKIIGIILAYNCASMLSNTVKKIPNNSIDHLIVVDDGSTDDTVDVARRLHLKVYTHPHVGYGGNIKFGIKKALELGATHMVEIHGDGQYDVSVIPMAVKKAIDKYDLLLGSRFTNLTHALQDKMPISRYLANLGLSFFDRVILNLQLTEFHSGFRVYSRRLFDTISFENTSDDYLYSFEIIAQAKFNNFRIGEIPIRCNYADRHTSIKIEHSIIYALQTMYVLLLYCIARLGIQNGIFRK